VSRPPSPEGVDRPVDRPTSAERPHTSLGSHSDHRNANRSGTWGRNTAMRTSASEQSIPMFERPASPESIVKNHRESLFHLIDELADQVLPSAPSFTLSSPHPFF
jgi:hypothetical protein